MVSKFPVEVKKLESLMSESVLLALCDSNAIIAGGTLTSLFSGKEVNDLDVYFKHPINAIQFAEQLNDEGRVSFMHKTDRSILCKDWDAKPGGQDVQMIVYKFFNNVEEIFAAFDFTVNMCAAEFSYKDDEVHIEIHMHEDFLRDLAQRRLVFNRGTDYPLVSDLRVEKYCAKGYTISKKEKFKILLAINAKNIDSWEVLKDELGSMYGLERDKMFDESVPFTIDAAMDQLELIVWADNVYNLNHPTLSVVKDVIAKNAKFKLNNMQGRYFKVVKKVSDGVYTSIYSSGYKYILGQTAAENNHGIYFAEGEDLMNSCYWSKCGWNDNMIIEIHFEDESQIKYAYGCSKESMIGKGQYQVVREYSKEQWINELKTPVEEESSKNITSENNKWHFLADGSLIVSGFGVGELNLQDPFNIR